MHVDIADFGFEGKKLQKEITHQIEAKNFEELKADYDALAHDDHRRWSFLAATTSKTARTLVTGWPDYGREFSTDEWVTALQMYLGLPLSILKQYVGAKIIGRGLGAGSVCDKYGRVLAAAQLPGGDWWKAHTLVQMEVAECLRAMGCNVVVEPTHTFFPEVPLASEVNEAQYTMIARVRPDFEFWMVDRTIGELKLVRATPSYYACQGHNTSANHECNPGRAMKTRQRSIASDYTRRAKVLDAHFHGWTADGDQSKGKVQAKLKQLRLRKLVGGWFGEISSDFEDLLDYMAEIAASNLQQSMMAATKEEAKAVLLFRLRSRINSTIMKAQARIVLGRLHHMAGSAATAEARVRRAGESFFPRGDASLATVQYAALGRAYTSA